MEEQTHSHDSTGIPIKRFANVIYSVINQLLLQT